MTTVAWDGTSLAADRRCSGSAGSAAVGKIFRLKDGRLLAGAGTYDDIVEVVAWLEAGAKEAKRPKLGDRDDGSDILLIDGGRAYWLTWPHLRPVLFNERFTAVGSGGPYALGAMAAGKSAKEAVEIAARFDNMTGHGVDVVQP